MMPFAESSKQDMSCEYVGNTTTICRNAVSSDFRTSKHLFNRIYGTVRCIDCNLTVLEANSFNNLGGYISVLDLTSSHIEILEKEAFAGLTTLRELKLQNNTINNIENGSFASLDSLWKLDLSNNKIEVLFGILNELPEISSINLAHNKISEIALIGNPGLQTLQSIDLSNNRIKVVKRKSFRNLPSLEIINLSNNPIATLQSRAFKGLSSLKTLNLSSCSISDVQSGVLTTLFYLSNLDLSGNKITTFTTGSFSGLPELKTLDLSHNKINTLKKTGVLSLPNLYSINLSHNNLRDLDYELLVEIVPRLASLDVSENPLSCSTLDKIKEYFKNDNLLIITNS
ncbi:hypothetical protein ILUMI_22700 [Ignelater luminosus]|uniref:Uncharacterized protein n=1 Tax=Ignelater luminosus TaxID=2038154 RepID=A0A8K0CF98_IGNLU|nr:hypothetical protein ILUMI_22700 [Ignelater luminosus]